MPRRSVAALLSLFANLACSSGDGGEPTGPGVHSGQQLLPPAGAAYLGSAGHRFLNGGAELTCSSHGGFTASVQPPTTRGGTVTADYVATFTGRLVLNPPVVAATATHPLTLPVHMMERITLSNEQGGVRTFDTELVRFELGGSSAPAGVMVRESSTLPSAGRATITTLPASQYRIEAQYDVWLEISLDGGRSWHQADAAVRMTLGSTP